MSGGYYTVNLKDALINSSCRRRPASNTLKTLDPGMRRDDDTGINQSFLKVANSLTDTQISVLGNVSGAVRRAARWATIF